MYSFTNFSKAFNNIDPFILLRKLEHNGVRGAPLKLLESYLTNRFQYTKVNDVKSDLKPVKMGVPQGSLLGPLLFLIYINDITKATNYKIRLFADDSCISIEHNNPIILQNIVNTELEKINNWLEINKLFLNYKKTTYLIFTNQQHQHQFNITVNNNIISQSHQTKYLGVILDDKMLWNHHTNHIKSKLARNNYALAKLRGFFNETTMKIIYYSLIYPFLQYCISSWGKAAGTHMEPLEKLQKQSIRHICKKPPRTHTNDLFHAQEILKLKEIYKYQVAKLIYRNNKNASIGDTQLKTIQSVHQYNTRLAANFNFYRPKSNTNTKIKSYSYQGPIIWEEIPLTIKESTTPIIFKIQLKRHFLESYVELS